MMKNTKADEPTSACATTQRRQRPSYAIVAEGGAGARLRLEPLLTSQHGLVREQIIQLKDDERQLLHRLALSPSPHDAALRAPAITALGMIGGADALAVLAVLGADDRHEDIIVGRAVLALGALGGPVAAYVIEKASRSDKRLVREQAMWAAVHSSELALGGVVMRAYNEYPSNVVRRRAYEWLRERGVAVDEPARFGGESQPSCHEVRVDSPHRAGAQN